MVITQQHHRTEAHPKPRSIIALVLAQWSHERITCISRSHHLVPLNSVHFTVRL